MRSHSSNRRLDWSGAVRDMKRPALTVSAIDARKAARSELTNAMSRGLPITEAMLDAAGVPEIGRRSVRAFSTYSPH